MFRCETIYASSHMYYCGLGIDFENLCSISGWTRWRNFNNSLFEVAHRGERSDRIDSTKFARRWLYERFVNNCSSFRSGEERGHWINDHILRRGGPDRSYFEHWFPGSDLLG